MDALKDSGVIIDEEGLKKTFNELQKKGKKINFSEFKAIALGKDEDEHNDIEKNIKKLTSFKEIDTKEFPEVINENNENNYSANENIEKKEKNFQKLIKNEINSNYDKITNKEEKEEKEVKEEKEIKEEKEEKEEIERSQNKKKSIQIINEIKENINVSNNACNDIIINNSINKKNEKSKSKSNSKSNNKSNVDVLVEEHNNNDKYTDVHN
jgi:hypothetical protein